MSIKLICNTKSESDLYLYIIINIEDMNKHSILKWDVLELIETNEKVSNANNTKIGESLYGDYWF